MSAVEQDRSPRGVIVTSPANERIEILSDQDWADITGHSLESVRRPYRSKLSVALALWHHGTIRERAGRATGLLYPLAVEMGYRGSDKSITTNMNDSLNAPAFDRQTNGKRTYAISLAALPERWYEVMQQMEPESFEADSIPEPSQGDRDPATLMEQVIMPAPDEPELLVALPEYVPPPEPLPEVSPYLEVAPQVAMALLTQVVEIITAGSPEMADQRVKKLTGDVADIADKLAHRLTENDALRKQLRLLGDEVNAVKYERDGLRTRLRLTEHNLRTALKSDVMAQVNERVMRELEKVMRVVPSASPRKGDPV